MRILITGINGFAGSHLADFLLDQEDVRLFGAGLASRDNIAHLEERITYFDGDLRDLAFVEKLLAESQPDRIYHLAGQAFPPVSWQDPWNTLEINLRSEVNVLHVAAQAHSAARILVIGSFDEYGRVDANCLPVTEESPLRPDSPYGVSKIAQDMLGLQYFQSHHLHIVRVRPSNHIGPRQNEQFVTSSFAKQIAEIEKGAREPVLYVGNLTAARDFTDVRDMMRAYYLALERGAPGEVYNIGSGRAVTISHVLDLLLGQSSAKIRVEQDPARLRPSDTPVLYCDVTKFKTQTGWEPGIPLESSLRDILDYWRSKTGRMN